MSNSTTYKIFRVFLFLIPIIIMIIMSFFYGKQGAAARFFRFKTTISTGRRMDNEGKSFVIGALLIAKAPG